MDNNTLIAIIVVMLVLCIGMYLLFIHTKEAPKTSSTTGAPVTPATPVSPISTIIQPTPQVVKPPPPPIMVQAQNTIVYGNIPCMVAGVKVPSPWYKLAPTDTSCLAPAGQKCCNKIPVGCNANFTNYTSDQINTWLAQCV